MNNLTVICHQNIAVTRQDTISMQKKTMDTFLDEVLAKKDTLLHQL